MAKPNILIFNPDQWRGDVMGHLGNPAAITPNLDDLITQDAVSFSNAFCQASVCTPSRCSFMTGWYPHTRGHRTMTHMLQPDEPMLLKTLKENGYYVWWGGKNDVVPAQKSFDSYCDVKYTPPAGRARFPDPHTHDDWRGSPEDAGFFSFFYGKIDKPEGTDFVDNYDQAMIDGAIDFIKNAPDDQPFCIYLPLGYPHPPYAVEEPFFSMIDRDALPARTPAPKNWTGKPSMLRQIYENQNLSNFPESWWNELRATYYGMCSRVDAQFGLIVKALKEAHLYDDTAIFVFSDHGDFTGDYGLVEKTQNTFEDCLVKVPLIIKPPAHMPVQAGIRDALVELIDFPATVEAITEIIPTHTHFGRSLLPIIFGETDTHRDAVFCQGGRTRDEKHTRELTPEMSPHMLYYPRLIVQHQDDVAHTKAVMVRTDRYKYVYRLYEQDELYDLEDDPLEQNNCIADPELTAIIEQLREKLIQFQVETSDVVPFKQDKR